MYGYDQIPLMYATLEAWLLDYALRALVGWHIIHII